MTKDIEKYYQMPDEENHSIYCHFEHDDEDWEIALQQHDSWEILYVIHGNGKRIIGNHEESFRNGEVVLLPPRMPHSWKFDKTADGCKPRHIMVSFTHQFLMQCMNLFPEFRKLFKDVSFPTAAIRLRGTQKVRKVLSQLEGKSGWEQLLMMLEIIPDIFTSVSTVIIGRNIQQDDDATKLTIAKSFVLKNFPRKITLQEVADTLGVSQSTFCSFFKRMTGDTFFDYLLRFRMDMACEILLNTNRDIAEICYAVGFSDIPHFNRMFKKYKGLSPSKWRKENSHA